ncbi:autophagy- protein 2 [Entomophthora muscae]|uniref:Autophagy- protein 2 n=1 Tax=Entomophthora muscae TaxID=34485 RepID=A0ACC2RKG8_9FUNG|nr:autophagy- protein 2 [Entomophthora muscae]
MYSFNWSLPDWAGASHIHKHLIRYLLKKSLGSFIKSDFALDTVDLEITKGQLSLRKLEINTEFINELLIGTPLQVTSGTIECINVTVPWQMVLSDPFQIHLDGLKLWIELSPSTKPRLDETFKSILEASTMSIANDFLSELQEYPEAERSSPSKEPETTVQVGGFIDKLVARLKLTLGSLEIHVAPKQGPQVTFHVESAEIVEDISPTEPIRILPSFLRRIVSNSVTVALDGGKTPIVRSEGAFTLLVNHTVTQDSGSQLSIQNSAGKLHAAMSPRQFEELSRFAFALKSCIMPFESTKENSFLDWTFEFSFETILLRLLYQSTSQNLFKASRTRSHLCIELMDAKIKAQNSSSSAPPFYTQSQAQQILVEGDILKLSVKEWLSSSQYPPQQIPKGAYSFARDCYLPVLMSDPHLPNSSLLLECLPLIGHEGKPAGKLSADAFKGLPTFWGTPHSLNPQEDALKVSLSIADGFKVHLSAAPTWVRMDPRLADRMEGFLLVLKHSDFTSKGTNDSPHHNMGIYESIIMNDLDSRDNVQSSPEWSFTANTEYLRAMIQAPCDCTGDDQEANHRFARVHSDCWILDCLKPWSAMPGPLPCIPGHAKIGYQGLDISLLRGPHLRTVYGFLSVGPSQEDGPTPTLEIGFNIFGRPNSSSRFSARLNSRFPVPFPPLFEGFSEGEVKAMDPSAQEEEILSFKQSTIDTSLFDIHCTFPRVQLNFTKEAYDATQFLLNDLSSWEPRFLKVDSPEMECPNSPLGSEESISFYTAREEGASFRGPSSMYSADPLPPPAAENANAQSLSTLIASMPLLEICLDMSPELQEPKLYSITYKNCQFFSTSKLHGKAQSYTFIEADELFFLDSTIATDPQVIISPTPCNFKNNFQLTSFSKLELPYSTIKEVSACISLTGLDYRFPLKSEPPPLVKHIVDFFSGDAKLSTVSSTLTRASVTFSLKELSLILLPETPNNSWIVMLIEKAGASTIIFPPDPVLHVHAGIGKAQLLLSQKEPDIFVPLPTDQKCDVPRSLQPTAIQFWESHQFVQIGSSDCLSCQVSIHNRDLVPQFGIDITNESLTFKFCRDSYLLFQQALYSLHPDDSPDAQSDELVVDDPKLGVLERSIGYNILDTLEENAYGKKEQASQYHTPDPFVSDMEFVDEFFGDDPEDCELNPPPSLTHIPQPRPHKRVSRKDFYRHTRSEYEVREAETEGDAVKVLDDSPFEIIDDYFALEREPVRPICQIDLENTKLRIRLHDFNLEIKLFDGQDWRLEASSSPQSSPQDSPAICRVHHQVSLSRPSQPSMELAVSQLRIDFSDMLPESEERFRLVFAANDIEILDYIPTSTWRKFLAPMKSSSGKLPRESQSEMLHVELTQIKPFPKSSSCEYRLKFSLLPIRLFVDQDALNFLIDFFLGDTQVDPLEPPESPPSDSSDDIYFQYVEISDLEVKLDYKPKHFSLRQLSEGNFAELVKIFQLEDAQLSLDKVRLTGVNGFARLTDELISHWLPQIKGSQIPQMVSGVGPMRTLSNLGSGVADLVLLPFQQFKKDGRIVKGVAKGVASFARSTTSEAVHVSASLVMGAQVILERADTLLRPPSSPSSPRTSRPETRTVSKYANQPENINEGMEFAYRSLRQNIGTAARTVLAVPFEVTERTGAQGTTRSIIRAIPIVVLQPMIGATQAVSMALLGLRNSLDPHRHERLQDKYKHRN